MSARVCVEDTRIPTRIHTYIYAHAFLLRRARRKVEFLGERARMSECALVCIYTRTRACTSPRGVALKMCVARRVAEQGSAEGGSEIVKFILARRAEP